MPPTVPATIGQPMTSTIDGWRRLPSPTPKLPPATAAHDLEEQARQLDQALALEADAPCSGVLYSLVQGVFLQREALGRAVDEELQRFEARQRRALDLHMQQLWQVMGARQASAPTGPSACAPAAKPASLYASLLGGQRRNSPHNGPHNGRSVSPRCSVSPRAAFRRVLSPTCARGFSSKPAKGSKTNKIYETPPAALQPRAARLHEESPPPAAAAGCSAALPDLDAPKQQAPPSPQDDAAVRRAVREEVRDALDRGLAQVAATQRRLQDEQTLLLKNAIAGDRAAFVSFAPEDEELARTGATDDEQQSLEIEQGASTAEVPCTASGNTPSMRPRSHTVDWRKSVNMSHDAVVLTARVREYTSSLPDNALTRALLSACHLMELYYTAEEPCREGRVAEIVQSAWFEVFCVGIITLNAVFSGVSVNLELQAIKENGSPFITITSIETVFVLWFLLEIAVKLYVRRIYFFCSVDARWNIFDIILVLLGTVEIVILWWLYSSNNEGENSPDSSIPFVMRILRVCRMARVLRSFRAFHILDELRLMLSCIIWSLGSFLWAALMLFVFTYMFALFFMVGVLDTLVSSPEASEGLLSMFDGVMHTCLTLFQCTTGGRDWSEVYNTVTLLGHKETVLFIFYISFFVVVLVNVITSIFVEQVLKITEPSPELMLKERDRLESRHMKSLEEVFRRMDVDMNGKVSREEFLEAVNSREFGMFLAARGIDIKEAQAFFELMGESQGDDMNRAVDVENMVRSCARMRGSATTVDLQIMRSEIRQWRSEIISQLGSMRDNMDLFQRLRSGCCSSELQSPAYRGGTVNRGREEGMKLGN